MSDSVFEVFEVGQQVTILDVNKVGEIVSISEDGTQFSVKYTDDAGQGQTEVVTADKLAPTESAARRERRPAASDFRFTGGIRERRGRSGVVFTITRPGMRLGFPACVSRQRIAIPFVVGVRVKRDTDGSNTTEMAAYLN